MARRAFFEITAEDEPYHWRDEDRRGTFFSSDVFDASRLPNREQCEIISVFIQSHLGYDHIDLAYCKSRGITVSNVPVYGDNTVAEHTFALILALSRKVIQSYDRAHSGNIAVGSYCGAGIDVLEGETLIKEERQLLSNQHNADELRKKSRGALRPSPGAPSNNGATLSQWERDCPEYCPSPSGRGTREAPGEGRRAPVNFPHAATQREA